MSLTSRTTAGILFFLGLAIILIYTIFSLAPILVSAGMLVFLCICIVFLLDPRLGIFSILFLRPSADLLSESFSLSIGDNFSIGAAPLFGIIVIALTATYLIRRRVRIFSLPLFFPWLLFILCIGLSTLYSIDPLSSIYETLRIISISSLFLLIFCIVRESKNTYTQMISLVLASAAIPIALAFLQLLTGSGLGGTTGIESRIYGTFVHPNAFASFLLIIFILSIFLAWRSQKVTRSQIIYWALALGTGLLLVSTFSRGAWLGLLIFLILFGIFKSPRIIFIGTALITILFFSSQTVHDRIEDIYNPPADSSILWRFQKWQKVYDVFKTAPLLGKGAGTELTVHEQEYGFYAGNPYTHNDFLKIALENGLLGFGLFLILIVSVIIRLIILLRKTQDPQQKFFIFCILLLFIAQLGFSMSSNIWRGTATMWTLWMLVATAFALQQKTPLKRADK